MRQPRLIRMRRTFICKNRLSSDVVSIASTYFLNSAHPSLKYGIQFWLIQTPQNPMQTLKKLVLVSQLNSFEFFLDCRKQVEVMRGQVRWIPWVSHAENIVFFKPICCNPTRVNRVTVEMNHKSTFMRRPSSRKDRLFEWNKQICQEIGAIHFDII
jgi:hypothetical protein